MEVMPGTRVAERYVVERALARGGMGAVFVAHDEQMGVRVALKVTAAAGAAADALARRFAREARIGNRLGARHQGFVRSLGWGKLDAVQLYLVMDLVDGGRPLDLRTGTLEQRLERWRRAADLVRVAHEQGVIHRDLKPATFLPAPVGSIHLTEFGLAKVVGEAADEPGEQSLTMTGVGFGTPPYMPPEQFEDAKHVDQRADVYALGCMLFEAAALRLPYLGATPTAVMSAHLRVRAGTSPPPRPRDVDPHVPEPVDLACHSALALEVEERCPSVATLFSALDGQATTRVEATPQVASISGVATAPPDTRPAGIEETPSLTGLSTSAPAASAPRSPDATATTTTTDASPAARAGGARRVALVAALVAVGGAAVAMDAGGARRRLSALVATSPSPTSESTPSPPPPPTTEPAPDAPSATEASPPVTQVRLVELTPADGAVIPALTVDVQGRVDGAGGVRVAGIACAVDGDGRFALRRLALEPGENELAVTVQPAAPGQAAIRRTLRLTVDPDDPALIVASPADGLETTGAEVSLRGRVQDATAVVVEVNGEVVAHLPPGGATFAAKVSLPVGRHTLEIVARDAGGRTARLTRTVVRAPE